MNVTFKLVSGRMLMFSTGGDGTNGTITLENRENSSVEGKWVGAAGIEPEEAEAFAACLTAWARTMQR